MIFLLRLKTRKIKKEGAALIAQRVKCKFFVAKSGGSFEDKSEFKSFCTLIHSFFFSTSLQYNLPAHVRNLLPKIQ
jgi:hypothetical protein